MRSALIIYWIWHLSVLLIANTVKFNDIFYSYLIVHLSYGSIWFLVAYPLYNIILNEGNVNHKYLWLFLCSILVRATAFHLQLIAGTSLPTILGIYGFGVIVFILLEKTFIKASAKLNI